MKICTICETDKHESEFHRDAHKKDGFASSYRECNSIRKKARYNADLDASRKKRRQDYANNKAKILESNRKSRLKHANSIRELKRKYYERVKNDPAWKDFP